MKAPSIVATAVIRVLCLGTAVGTAAALTPVLIAGRHYVFLAIVWAVIAVVLATYATARAVPAKYLVPGTLLLILFIVVPVLSTLQLSTTNYGDGTRTTRQETVERILANSVVQVPDSPKFNLSVATTGSPASGPITFFLVDQKSGALYSGTEAGLAPLERSAVTVTDNFVSAATGYTILTPLQVNAAADRLRDFTVPTGNGAIRQRGLHEAYEGRRTLQYDQGTGTITNTVTGVRYTTAREGDREYFVGPDGTRLSDQSWRSDVGLANYRRAFTDQHILSGFTRIFIWNVVFATASVALTFLVGLGLAVTLNDSRVRGQKVYRSVLLLPYAIPGFISILVWSGFYNQDFGLINQITGLHVNWLGSALWAKVALLLTNLWLGFPYMFLVSTGALQAIPSDLREAASIDGAGGFTAFRRITFPLLLVAVTPLLVASFAFNFNNYNVIELLTHGGPFSPGNPDAGATDILISYTVRLAFGGNGAQLGFAAAIATLLFAITAIMAAAQYRITRRLEEMN
ncbi:ABC transporter permease subunit [Kineosporia sp. NBRC 101731]|uniref:ABC transporter permease subunit n=1 Tax=Kineosporia sp. NBRC 101731 TaxID=3032199 RepID=UPI0024A15E67|nr:ABC transporter permease subunit [Kineosporia sp. NBRC 101731]GLY29685.1 sugar ABC transporter permease [Kineosporia sp. NBRC 101731]